METKKSKWAGLGAIVVARQSDDAKGNASTEAQNDHVSKAVAAAGMHVVDRLMLAGVPASAPARVREVVEGLFQRKRERDDFDVIAWQIEDRATRGGGGFGMWLEHEAKRHGLRVYYTDSEMDDRPYSAVIRVPNSFECVWPSPRGFSTKCHRPCSCFRQKRPAAAPCGSRRELTH
jgi:hypothetical protein